MISNGSESVVAIDFTRSPISGHMDPKPSNILGGRGAMAAKWKMNLSFRGDERLFQNCPGRCKGLEPDVGTMGKLVDLSMGKWQRIETDRVSLDLCT